MPSGCHYNKKAPPDGGPSMTGNDNPNDHPNNYSTGHESMGFEWFCHAHIHSDWSRDSTKHTGRKVVPWNAVFSPDWAGVYRPSLYPSLYPPSLTLSPPSPSDATNVAHGQCGMLRCIGKCGVGSHNVLHQRQTGVPEYVWHACDAVVLCHRVQLLGDWELLLLQRSGCIRVREQIDTKRPGGLGATLPRYTQGSPRDDERTVERTLRLGVR